MTDPSDPREVRRRVAAKLARILWKRGVAEILIDEAVGYSTSEWKWYVKRDDPDFFKRYARKRGPKALYGTRREITEDEEVWLRNAYGKRMYNWKELRERLNLSQWNLMRILKELGIYRVGTKWKRRKQKEQ